MNRPDTESSVPRPGALLVDMDGTIADSLDALRRAYDAFLTSFGIEASDEGFARANGIPLRRVVADLKHEHGLAPDERALVRRFVDAIGSAYEDVPPMPGALRLLERARDRGMPVAVVTSAAMSFATAWLERTGLVGAIDHVVGGDSVEVGKPAPDPYLRALELTAAAAPVSVAVEDTAAGARAAVAAGIPTWVLGREVGEWPAVRGFVARLDDVRL